MYDLKYVNLFPKIAAQLPSRRDRLLADIRDLLKKRARELAPVSNNNEPGHVHLRDTIDAWIQGSLVILAASAPYAGFVEYGTRFQSAHPFMTPAIEEARQMLSDRIGELLEV